MNTVDADTKFKPTPPAFMETRKTEPRRIPSLDLSCFFEPFENLSNAATLSFMFIAPSRRLTEIKRRVKITPNISRKPRNWEKITILEPGSSDHTTSSSLITARSLALLAPPMASLKASRAASLLSPLTILIGFLHKVWSRV
eukprot:CAMPEP_0116039872 /NCGR_PEP_ID=MMETSP0321-20121206/23933_1 /TAXON_ID=163516 /ORGANISM="Leptocylindrus danicus var. danicus, Strain B650" /LENGTH=141 /DNA_ID=CAMNT_0003519401 /DNA_START=256 /DNA_END=681 /DNA_ORIENTATION=-